MYTKGKEVYSEILKNIKEQGLWKEERIITTQQANVINTTKADKVLNFCANNYLGLANNAEIIAAAKEGYDQYGSGMSSVRFICCRQTVHKQLEQEISKFLGTEDTIIY